MTLLERIIERVKRQGDVNDPATPRPLLTLGEFFEGNDCVGSIGCNLDSIPTPADFLGVFKQIAARGDVADVRVQITAFDAPEWPFSDVVWIIASAEPQEVANWFPQALRPDECWTGWPMNIEIEACPVPNGMQPVGCWWD